MVEGERVLRLLKKERVARSSQKLPTLAACGDLEQVIDALRYEQAVYEFSYADQTQRIAGALETLSEVLPQIYPYEEGSVDAAVLEQLAQAVETARLRPWGTRPVEPSYHWHRFARELAEAFREAMRSTNPNLKIAFSNKGLMSRFLEAAIPMVDRENRPPGETVIRYLRRQDEKLAEGNTPDPACYPLTTGG